MAEKEIYRLEVNVDITGDEKTKKKLSAMDKYFDSTKKKTDTLDKVKVSPAVKLKDKLTSPLKKMEGKIGSFAKKAVKGFTAVATAGAVLVGGIGIGSSMSTFMDFEAGLSGVQAVSQATAEEMRLLKDEAKRLGAETEWSAVQVTEAEQLLAQAGFSVQENISALPGLLSLASAGGVELSEATDIAAGTLRAFGLEADQAGHLADVLAVAASSTNSDITGLGESMKYVGPAAKALGVDVEQTTAALGMLANANIKGSQAGTTLRSAFTRLAKPTDAAASLMKELGFNAFDAQGKMLPLDQVVGNLEKSTAGLTDQQKASAMATMFGQEAMSGMLALVEQGPDAFKELTDSLYESEGAAEEMANTRLDNLAGQMTILKSATEGMKIELGERLAPYAKEFVEWLTPKIPIITEKIVELVDKASDFATKAYPAVKDFMSGLKDMLPIIGNLVPAIAGIAAAIATIRIGNKISGSIKTFKKWQGSVSLAAKGAGGFKAALGAMMGPIGWVALAIGAAVTAGILLWKNWDKIKEKAGQLGSWISDKWNGIKEATSNAWESVKTTVSDKWNSLKDTVMGIGPAIKDAVVNTWTSVKEGTIAKWQELKEGVSNKITELKSYIEDKFFSLPDTVLEPISRMKESITNIFNGIKDFFSGYWQVIKNIFLGALLVILDIVTLDFEKLKTDIAQIWENIKEGLNLAWEGIKQIFSGALDFIKAYSDLVWNSIKEVITYVWDTVTEWLVGVWESIKTSATEGWNSLKESVSSIITSTGEWIKETWDGIVEWFTTLPERLYEKGVAMFNSLKDGLASMKETVVGKVTEVGNGIVEKVKELPGQMLQIGKDIMSGLADGITSMVTAPIKAAKGVATSISEGIRSKLKIKSPSRVMMEYGGYTTEGLAVGMEDETPRLQEAVGRTYDVVTREDTKVNNAFRSPFAEKVVNKVRNFNPFNPNPDDPDNPRPQVAQVAGVGGVTYQINIDDIDVTLTDSGDDGDIEEIVNEAQNEFGRKLLAAIKDKK